MKLKSITQKTKPLIPGSVEIFGSILNTTMTSATEAQRLVNHMHASGAYHVAKVSVSNPRLVLARPL